MYSSRAGWTSVGVLVATVALSGAWAEAPPPNSQANPYRTVEGWAKMPEGRTWGATSAVDVNFEELEL